MADGGYNWLDRLLAWVAPRAAFERIVWRQALRSYDSGDSSRLNAGWTPYNVTAEQHDSPHRDNLRARARDLERNSDVLESIVRPFERNVVGTGIKLQALPAGLDGTDMALAERLEETWERWCRPWQCDLTHQQSFAEICRMAVRRIIVDGGILLVKTSDPQGRYLPYCLQVREVDDLDTTVTMRLDGNRYVTSGIEMDALQRPLAYHLKTRTPDGWEAHTERVPADRVLFLWQKRRPSQVREISRLAPTIGRVRDINEFLEATSKKERVAACLAMFITSQMPSATLGRGLDKTAQERDSTSGYYGETISPGMIMRGQPGDSVQAIIPPNSGNNAREFVMLQQRMAASGQGLSYEAAARDLSQVNYSSARQGRLEDQGEYDLLAQYLIDHLLTPVYEDVVVSAVLSERISLPDFWRRRDEYLTHHWMAPGQPWIDPLKEAKADAEALATNQDTLANRCARRGLDWKEVLAQRAVEVRMEDELGIRPPAKGQPIQTTAPDVEVQGA